MFHYATPEKIRSAYPLPACGTMGGARNRGGCGHCLPVAVTPNWDEVTCKKCLAQRARNNQPKIAVDNSALPATVWVTDRLNGTFCIQVSNRRDTPEFLIVPAAEVETTIERMKQQYPVRKVERS